MNPIPNSLPPHFWRHAMQVAFALALTTVSDVLILEYVKPRLVSPEIPMAVWSDLTAAKAVPPIGALATNSVIQIGYDSQGIIRWRFATNR